MDVAKFRQEIASAKERLIKTQSIIAELSKVMEDSRRVIAEVHAVRAKARQLTGRMWFDRKLFLGPEKNAPRERPLPHHPAKAKAQADTLSSSP